MLAFVLMIAALLQGVPVLPNQGGTISGTLRSAGGAPAAGVRVSALTKPDKVEDLSATSSLAGLAETDASGRYLLENIAPGRYYIVAGRLDAPTYYPGVVTATQGRDVLVIPGATVNGIDFVLNNASAGRAPEGSGSPVWVVGIQVRVENGGGVPVFTAGRFPFLRFTRSKSPTIEAAFNLASVTLPYSDYRVTVESLPEGYALRALTFGTVDLTNDELQLAPQGVPSLPGAAGQNIALVLTRRLARETGGVRISGRIQGNPRRSIYISGTAGSTYADGSFEFGNVPPGRHTIVTLDNPDGAPSLGAELLVTDRDITGVALEELSVAPAGASVPGAPALPVAGITTSRITAAAIRGRVVAAETREPFSAGKVVVNGNYSRAVPLNDDGTFEIPKLLSGQYVLEATVFGIGTITKTVEVDRRNVLLELSLAAEPPNETRD